MGLSNSDSFDMIARATEEDGKAQARQLITAAISRAIEGDDKLLSMVKAGRRGGEISCCV